VQHEFVFDDVFDETIDNEEVYERTVKPLVLRLFERSVDTTREANFKMCVQVPFKLHRCRGIILRSRGHQPHKAKAQKVQ